MLGSNITLGGADTHVAFAALHGIKYDLTFCYYTPFPDFVFNGFIYQIKQFDSKLF